MFDLLKLDIAERAKYDSKCGIYSIINKITGEMYIGQSINIMRRLREHKYDYLNNRFSHPKLHLSLDKYGYDCFTLNIIEYCKPSELNEKEIYYINLYDTYNLGLNSTPGGNSLSGTSHPTASLSEKQLNNILYLLSNTSETMVAIADKVGTSEDIVSYINLGKTYRQDNIKYPIREIVIQPDRHCISCGEKIYKYGESKYCRKCASNLWAGENNPSATLTNVTVLKIKDEILNSDKSFKKIAREFNINQSLVSHINLGESWRSIGEFTYPIRDNRGEIFLCKDCGCRVTRGYSRCIKCANKLNRKVDRPSRDEFKELLKYFTFATISRKFRVSDSTIRYWCKQYGLPSTSRELKMLTVEEWENI